MLKWQVNHDGTEYMLLEQSETGSRQILAEVYLGASGIWHWSATRDDGTAVDDAAARSPGRCIAAAEDFLEGSL